MADVFLARARLEGAATLAGLAGAPIAVGDLQDWIAGRTPPPRASEGLNDPGSVAAVFHFAVSRDEGNRDPVLRATLNSLRAVLDDRSAAQMWGGEDLAYFGPLWRLVRAEADRPFEGGGLSAVAERIFEIAEMTREGTREGADVVTFDGRTLAIPARARDRNWLIAAVVPLILCRARITTSIIPSFVLLPKFLPESAAQLADIMHDALAKAVAAALGDLDRIEKLASRKLAAISVTRRSRAPLLARLEIAYPGLQPKAVARLLGITPQGARKLMLASQRGPIRTNGGPAPRG